MEERRDKLGRRINPNSLKNLKPCKPGERRNPKGGPRREASLTRIARGMLPKVCPYDSKDCIVNCKNCPLVAESKRLFGMDLITI